MIRINLLETERAPGKKKAAAAPGVTQLWLILGVFVIGALGVSAVGWWIKSSSIAELDAQIEQTERRKQELDKIAKKVAKFEAQKKLLELKLATIDRLKGQQKNAIHLLDEISKALPDFVWLDTMQQTGNGLRFIGKSNSLNAVADFQESLLKATHPEATLRWGPLASRQPDDPEGAAVCSRIVRKGCWFSQVDLGNTTEKDRVVDFTLTATFQPPPLPKPQGADATAADTE